MILKRHFYHICLILGLIFSCIIYAGVELPDPDIWWNTAAGIVTINTGNWPNVEFFGEHDCYDPEPIESTLPSVLLAIAFQTFNLHGLVIWRLIGTLVCALMCVLALSKHLGFTRSVIFSSAIIAAISFRLSPRPELISFVIMPLFIWRFTHLIELTQTSVPRIASGIGELFLIQAFWTWSHGASPLAIILVSCFSIGLVIERTSPKIVFRSFLGLIGVLCGALTRPGAIRALWSPGVERSFGEIGALREWASPIQFIISGWRDISLVPFFVLLFTCAMVAILFCIPRFMKQGPLSDLHPTARFAAFLPLLVLSFDTVRGLSYGAIGSILLLPLLVKIKQQRSNIIMILILISALAVMTARLNNMAKLPIRTVQDIVPTRLAPLHASDVIRIHRIQGLLLAPLHLSNYFLLFNYPDVRVVWSGRRTYTLECMKEILSSFYYPSAFVKLNERLRPDMVLVSWREHPKLFEYLAQSEFNIASFDLRNALFVRPGIAAPQVDLHPDTLISHENRKISNEDIGYALRDACLAVQILNFPEEAGQLCIAGEAYLNNDLGK